MNIDVTSVNLVTLAKEAYKLSVLQGLGFLHFEEGGLTDEEAQGIVDSYKDDKMVALSMDYVKGRACKMHVHREKGKLHIRSPWYDHTDAQLKELLIAIQVELPKPEAHGMACNCIDCQRKRE